MSALWNTEGPCVLTIGGKRLEYRCIGPAPRDAPTLVLLHEGLGCVALWRDFPDRLAKVTGLGVFVYSRAGYGQSDPAELPRPLDFMTREAVDVLPQVLDAVGIGKAVLIGHSDGASIAAIHGGQVRDPRIAGLVLMAPHFFTEEMGLAEIAKTREVYEQTDMARRMGKYHRNPDNAFRGWNGVWLDPDFKSWNIAGVIDMIAVPVLALQGRDDQYGTQAQIEVIQERIRAPLDVVILDDCRHSPQFEQPEKTLEAVAQFATRLASPAMDEAKS